MSRCEGCDKKLQFSFLFHLQMLPLKVCAMLVKLHSRSFNAKQQQSHIRHMQFTDRTQSAWLIIHTQSSHPHSTKCTQKNQNFAKKQLPTPQCYLEDILWADKTSACKHQPSSKAQRHSWVSLVGAALLPLGLDGFPSLKQKWILMYWDIIRAVAYCLHLCFSKQDLFIKDLRSTMACRICASFTVCGLVVNHKAHIWTWKNKY